MAFKKIVFEKGAKILFVKVSPYKVHNTQKVFQCIFISYSASALVQAVDRMVKELLRAALARQKSCIVEVITTKR
jgi:hypothetical protein